MVRTVVVKPSDTDKAYGEKYEGTWFNNIDDMTIYKEDVDVYGIQDDGSKRLLAKFRKHVLPDEIVQKGWDAFRNAANPSRNRGAAAGPIDKKGKYWSRRKPIKTE